MGHQSSSSRQSCSCQDSAATWKNQAMRSGLTPFQTHAASINHTQNILCNFVHNTLTHVNKQADTQALSAMHNDVHPALQTNEGSK